MNETEFFLKYRGKYLDNDGVYGAQCVDVIKQYFTEVLGVPAHTGNAIDYWNNPPKGFTKIAKTLFNTPRNGDIIIFNTSLNLFGHIGICNWYRTFDLNVFQQNDPIGSKCDYKTYTYKNVIGWLRPQKKVNFKCVVIERSMSDGALIEAEKFVNDKLLGWSGGKLGFEMVRFVDANLIDPTPNTSYHDEEVLPVLKSLNLSIKPEEDYVLVIYTGNQMLRPWTYTKLDDRIWNVPFTIMPDNFNSFKDGLLFEVGHALIFCYNKRRGQLPSISNMDNYSGGEQYVKAKVEAIMPHLELI